MAKPQVDLLLRKSKIVEESTHTLSIRDQETRGRAWAAHHGYRVRRVFKENLSAFSSVHRPAQEAALSALLGGDVDALWVSAMDRWSRKGAESVLAVLAAKARLIFDYERLDSSEERDRKYIISAAEDARAFSVRLTTNLVNTKAQMRKDGRWLSRAPHGMKAGKDRHLRPDKNWCDIELIYTRCAQGASVSQIQQELRAGDRKSPSGLEVWPKTAISRVIWHPVYEGWMTLKVGDRNVPYLTSGGKRVWCVAKKHRSKLIGADLAAQARASIQGNRLTDTPPQGRAKYMLVGRAKCPGCRGPLVASGRNYACSINMEKGTCPDPTYVSRGVLDPYVAQQWSKHLSALDINNPDDAALLVTVARRWTALKRPQETAEIAEAKSALKTAQAALERFHRDDRAGFYEGRSARYRKPAKREAEARLSEAEARVEELSSTGLVDIGWLLNGSAEEFFKAADLPLQRELIGLVIDRIWVKPAKGRGYRFDGLERVEIEWATAEDSE